MMNDVSGTIFSIKRFSLHDGPHLRTTVFLSGCPLECKWCHNPEGMSLNLKTVSSTEKCIGCGECLGHCPQQALSMGEHTVIRDEDRCNGCGECVPHCPALVHEQTGWLTTVGAVLAEIEKDMPFYDQSGGGVTFSGGEPFAQPAFLMSLLNECRARAIHRAVDTSAYVAEALLLEAAEVADLMMCDIKHMDPVIHKDITGVDNKRILDNIRLLAEAPCELRIRLPLIPGINDSSENISATIAFLKDLNAIDVVDVLPYHRAAKAKYRKLGSEYPGDHIPELRDDRLEQTVTLLGNHGITAVIGG